MNLLRLCALLLTVIAPAAIAADLPPDTAFHPNLDPTLAVHRAAGKIEIDGQLQDPGWQGAARADNFCEFDPGHNSRPPVKSFALVAYDDSKLYVAFVAYDNPKAVRVSLRDRDNIFDDDYFGLMLDTYGDAGWGYEIFVNPLGLQGDLRMLSRDEEDASFDLVWDSKGTVTDSGYQVELAIPFSSLRFPDKPQQTWKINFWRDHQRDARRRYSWAAIDRGNSCFLCQWGTLSGIEGIKPGNRLDLLPNIVASEDGEPRDPENPDAGFVNHEPKAELSLNARYGLTTNSSAELTVNPDFSQVESDATQIDVNSPFALLYPEHRPFFQEGGDLFSSPIDVIYTRSISNPQAAGKLTGRLGSASFAYLVARDEHTPMLVPLEDKTDAWQAGKSTSNVLRAKQFIGTGSYVGGILTDRRLDDGGAGTVFGGDALLRFLTNYSLQVQAVASRTAEPNDTLLTPIPDTLLFERGRHTRAFNGETFWGHALSTNLAWDTRISGVNVNYTQWSPTFRADNGFITRNDRRELETFSNLTFRPNKKYLQAWEASLNVARVWNFVGTRKDEWISPGLEVVFVGQTSLSIEYLLSRELYRNVWFDNIHRATVEAQTHFSDPLVLYGQMTVGTAIARSYSLPTPELGNSLDISASATIKLLKRLAIEPQWNYSRLDSRRGGPRFFDASVVRTRFNYQFTREWFLRLVIEHVDEKDLAGQTGLTEKYRSLTFEPLVSYKLNPFTIFYLGSTHDYYDAAQAGTYRRISQRFFMKFQYLFRL